MISITISRLDEYPADMPDSYVVGFLVKLDDGNSFYLDTIVPFKEATDSNTAVEIAYSRLEKTIAEKVKAFQLKQTVGKVYKTVRPEEFIAVLGKEEEANFGQDSSER